MQKKIKNKNKKKVMKITKMVRLINEDSHVERGSFEESEREKITKERKRDDMVASEMW